MPPRRLNYRDAVLQLAPKWYVRGTYRDGISRNPDEVGPGAGNFFGPTNGDRAGLGVQCFETAADVPRPVGSIPPAGGGGWKLNGAMQLTSFDVDALADKCTLIAWVSLAVDGNIGQNMKAVCKHNAAPMPPCLANLDGKPLYEIGIGGVYRAASSPRFFLKDVPRMLAITYDGARFKSWDDAAIVDDQAQVGAVATNLLAWSIGALHGPGNFWNGTVSDAAFWDNRGLKDDEIRYLYEVGRTRKRSKHTPDEETIASQLTAVGASLKEGAALSTAEDIEQQQAQGIRDAELVETREEQIQAAAEDMRDSDEPVPYYNGINIAYFDES